jgi:ribosome-associated protein
MKKITTLIIETLADLKAEDIIEIDTSKESSLTDCVIIVTGRSSRHVNSISHNISEELKKHGYKDIKMEGMPSCDWVLIDAGDIIINVFRPEVRDFYNIEKIWTSNLIRPELSELT